MTPQPISEKEFLNGTTGLMLIVFGLPLLVCGAVLRLPARQEGLSVALGMVAIGASLAAIGGLIIVRHRRRHAPSEHDFAPVSPSRLPLQSPRIVQQDSEQPAAAAAVDLGPRRLKTKESRLVGLLLGTIFAILFLGCAYFSAGGFVVVKNNGAAAALYCLAAAFFFAGIVFTFGVIYSFASLWNPQVDVAVSNGTLPLGTTSAIIWKFRGNSKCVRRLVVFCEGREVAEHDYGTETQKRDNVFWKTILQDTRQPDLIRAGMAAVSIPLCAMHTFAGKYNRIEWSVTVWGEIRWWPDVVESYEITVLPREA